jgi:hypothetical protein
VGGDADGSAQQDDACHVLPEPVGGVCGADQDDSSKQQGDSGVRAAVATLGEWQGFGSQIWAAGFVAHVVMLLGANVWTR